MLKRPKSIYNMKKKTDSELLQVIGMTFPEDDQHCDAMAELEWRKSWRSFWMSNFVSWSALALSAIAILISLKIIKPPEW